MRRLCVGFVGICVLLLSGCKKLDYQNSITVEKGSGYHESEFKAAKNEQEMQAAVKADETVSVYLVLGDDKDEAINALRVKRAPRKVLASEEKTKEATLKAKVPAGKPFVLLIVPLDREKAVKVDLDIKEK